MGVRVYYTKCEQMSRRSSYVPIRVLCTKRTYDFVEFFAVARAAAVVRVEIRTADEHA